MLRSSRGAYIITVSGTDTAGYNGDNILGTAAQLNNPYGVAVDASGNLFIADHKNSRIREVDHTTGMITTVAGNGTAGYGGDGGQAAAAQLNLPSGIALDAAGNLYIADTVNNRIREVNLGTGLITTVAGNGVGGFTDDGGAATAASLNSPVDVTVDLHGNLFFVDYLNQRVREVNHVNGIIRTIAGKGTIGETGDGESATQAELDDAFGVSVDAAGDVFIADQFNNRIVEVFAGQTLTVDILH